jgi:flagellar biosynthesis protein
MDSADKEENPRAMAVALAYGAGSGAPKVVAKGKGLMADQIIKKAKESGVFVHESKELVSLLMQVDLDRHIPPGLYTAVAELLAWVYRLENRIIDNKAQHKTAPAQDTHNNNET